MRARVSATCILTLASLATIVYHGAAADPPGVIRVTTPTWDGPLLVRATRTDGPGLVEELCEAQSTCDLLAPAGNYVVGALDSDGSSWSLIGDCPQDVDLYPDTMVQCTIVLR